MIQPTEADIGRKVVYREYPGADPEEGVISSIPNPDNRYHGIAVWVRYKGHGGEMTLLNSLEWMEP